MANMAILHLGPMIQWSRRRANSGPRCDSVSGLEQPFWAKRITKEKCIVPKEKQRHQQPVYFGMILVSRREPKHLSLQRVLGTFGRKVENSARKQCKRQSIATVIGFQKHAARCRRLQMWLWRESLQLGVTPRFREKNPLSLGSLWLQTRLERGSRGRFLHGRVADPTDVTGQKPTMSDTSIEKPGLLPAVAPQEPNGKRSSTQRTRESDVYQMFFFFLTLETWRTLSQHVLLTLFYLLSV